MAGPDYCQDKAAPEGSNLYYAALFHDVRTRHGLYALFALYQELLDGFIAASDPGIARIRQEWWREELARLQAGRPRHPVTGALHGMGMDTAAAVTDLPDAVESLFPASDEDSLEQWLTRPGIGRFWERAAELAGPGGSSAAAQTGMLLARLEQLQHLPPLLRLGHQPLPGALLTSRGLDRDTLLGNPGTGPVTGLFVELITTIDARLDVAWREGRRDNIPLFVLILNRLGTALCREIRRDGYALLQHRVALTPIRKLWIATRTRYTRLLAQAVTRHKL